MQIVDIFKDKELMDEFFETAVKDRKVSNVNAYAGTNAENNLCYKFNSTNKEFKLYNEKLLIEVVIESGCPINWNGHCKDTKDFVKKIKETEGDLSASDLFLFEIVNGVRVLRDFASLKTSITTKNSDKLTIHNDSDGGIHDSLNSQKNRNIGNIILAMYRSGSYKVYHYQNNFQLFNNFVLNNWMTTNKQTKNTKRTGLQLEHNNSVILKAYDRSVVNSGKQTSYARGFFIVITKNNPFKNPGILIKNNILKEINNGTVNESNITSSLFKQFSC